MRGAAGDQRVERLGRGGRVGGGAEQRAAALGVACGQPAEREGGQIGLDRDAVECDRALQRGAADGHQPALPGKAERDDVGDDRVAEKAFGELLRVERVDPVGACGQVQPAAQVVDRHACVGLLHRRGHRRLVQIGHHPGAAMAQRLQRLGRGADHQIAGQQRVGLLRVDAHLMQHLRPVGQAHEAQHRAALLREAHEVEHAGRTSLQMRRHRDQHADGDDAGAADPGDQQIPGRVAERVGHGRCGQRVDPAAEVAAGAGRVAQRAAPPPGRGAHQADEARAEALGAGLVEVAGRGVDAALAAHRRVDRLHRDAVGLRAAVAAALADAGVDVQPARRRRQFALAAPAALLGGAGLLVDQHRHAFRGAQLALHRVERVAVVEGGAGRKALALAVVLADVVAEQRDAHHALGLDLAGDAVRAGHAVDRLAAGHRHRVVEQDLVGQRRFRRHRLADREVAGVVVGAVAEVLEDMRLAGEHRVRDPVDALAAHLDQALGVAVHPARHEMAADAGLRARALGHLRREVVRAAGAEPRRAPRRLGGAGGQARHGEVDDEGAAVQPRIMRRQPGRDRLDQPGGAQLAQLAQQRRAAAVALADQRRPGVGGRGVEQLAQLLLDDRRLLLDDQDLAQAVREGAQPRGLDRPAQAHLVEPHAGGGELRRRQVEPAQHLHQVRMRLADGDDADRGLRRLDHHPVDRIDAREGAHRVELGVQALLDRQRGQVGPAVVQAVGRRREAGSRSHRVGVMPARRRAGDRVQVDGGAALDHLRERGHADPGAREARQRPAVQAELDQLGDAGRRQHRHLPGLEDAVALVRHRRGHAAVVVASHHQHAAVRRGAVGVAVVQRVAGAVHAGPLAVPEREHAFDLALRIGLDALRAQHRGGGQLLVDRRQEAHAGRLIGGLRLPDLLVDLAERRAAVAADEAGAVQAACGVRGALHQRQPHQRLRAAEQHCAAVRQQRVLQPDLGAQQRVRGQRGVHPVSPVLVLMPDDSRDRCR